MAGVARNEITDAVKRLAKAVALSLPGVFLRAAVVVFGFGIMNLVFAVWLFIHAGMGGHGHAGIAALPLAAIPFIPFFAVALALAHAQGVSRLLAAAVESQAPALAAAGEQALATFLESNESLWVQKTQKAFGKAWMKYLRTRSSLPRPVRFLLSQLCAKVAMFELLDELGAKDISSEELPREFMCEVIARASSGLLRPRWRPILILLAANVLCFGIFFVELSHN